MEFLIGITGQDFVLLAADTLAARSILVMSSNIPKIHSLSSHQLLAISGQPGETDRLKERLLAESSLANFRMGRSWTVKESAQFTRSLMADALRSRTPHSVELLIAGVDENGTENPVINTQSTLTSTQSVRTFRSPKPSIYWIDHLAALNELPYAAHGYGSYFTWGLLDARFKPSMNVDEAVSLLVDVLDEIQCRFIVQIPKLTVKVIDASGIRDIHIDFTGTKMKRADLTSSSSSSTKMKPVIWNYGTSNDIMMDMEILA